MKKNEFLSQLKAALEQELDSHKVKAHVDYYIEYIQNEMNKGLTEEEILSQLGDPWAIAKTIFISEEISEQDRHSENYEEKNTVNRSYSLTKNTRWKIYAVIAVIALVVLLILSLVFGVIAIAIRLVIRFAVPIMVITLVWKFFLKK